jgi:signal transduction histidine kinase
VSNRFVRNVKSADSPSLFAYSDLVRVDVHDRRSVPWQLIAAAVLLVLLGTVGTLQYRWLGEVSEAERQRMRAGLQTRAGDFTQEFDRQITQIYVAFHGEPDSLANDSARAIAAALARVQASATVPGLIKDVFLLEGQGPPADLLQRFDPVAGALQPAEWPPPLDAWRRRAGHTGPLGVAGMPIFMADAVDATVPALIIPVPPVRRIEGGAGHFAVVPDPGAAARAIIVWLDADRLRRHLLEPLVAKYFGTGDASEYLVSIVRRDNPSDLVYTSATNAIVDEHADVSTGMFDLRMNEMTRLADAVKPVAGRGSTALIDRVAVTIVRRASGPGDAARVLMTGSGSPGAWLVRARYRSGTLDTIVAKSRRRNLAISAGVLGLLGAAFILIGAAAQRQRRLARQQMEFVASVSHELRTPLAVICSAGENLADGVVADAAQVRTYGSLIEAEGRRLGDMVERVMEFAGIGSGAAIRTRGGVDIAEVVADAVRGVSAGAAARGVTVTVHGNGTLPAVTADADALRSAVQNIVGNAVKYSVTGGSVDVTVGATVAGVEIRVADRGLGIDPTDLPHIFEPFFRGRRAVDAQVRGTGVGLSVVRHVIAAHHGTIVVDSRVGEGTVVAVTLPPDVAGRSPQEEIANDSAPVKAAGSGH